MITTARMIRTTIQQESGRVLVLTLMLLVTGSLILAPLLGLMSTGLLAGQVYEKNMALVYAADAGVEYGIWHLKQGRSPDDVLELDLNGVDVIVSIVKRDDLRTACHEPAIYDITSTATGTDGSSVAVLARVTNIYVYIETDILNKLVTIEGDVYAESDLLLDNESRILGNAIVRGNLILNASSLVGGIVCVAGDLTLNEGAIIESDLYVGGNLLMMGGSTGSWIYGNVYVQGTVEMQGRSEIGKDESHQELWAGGDSVNVDANARVCGDVHVTPECVVQAGQNNGRILGNLYDDYFDHDCPLGFAPPKILIWIIV